MADDIEDTVDETADVVEHAAKMAGISEIEMAERVLNEVKARQEG